MPTCAGSYGKPSGRPPISPSWQRRSFLIIRGFAFSQQLLDAMAYDTVMPKQDRGARHRRLLAQILAPYIEIAAATER